MADSENNLNNVSESDLLCQEQFLNDQDQTSTEPEPEPEQEPCCLVSEDEDCYVENMFNRESFFGFGSVSDHLCSPATQAFLKSARSESLRWIFDTRELFGFNFRTAYLSITFFDRFLSKRHIDNGMFWAMRLLSVACLSLAAKIEECQVPLLTEFPVQDYQFESKSIQRMELLVLSALEWKMGSMTPFSYLNYFVDKLCPDEDGDPPSKGLVISIAVGLILAMTRETNLIVSRPSIVAASAILVASDSRLTREMIEVKMNVIKFLSPQDMEIEKRKVKTPQFSLSPNVVLSIVQPNSATTTTKRRLTFSESDQIHQNIPVKKPHRT